MTSIQRVLDCHCLVGVEINPEMRVKVAPGPARPELVEHGWRQFLVKVHNEAGMTAVLRGISSQARRLAGAMPDELRNLWLDLQMFDSQPLTRTLSGLELEYRIVQLYSRDAGKREATLRSTSARARRTSASATKSRFSSPSGPRNRCSCACGTKRVRRRSRHSSFATRRAASIRRRPSGSRPTSRSIRRSIAPTANA